MKKTNEIAILFVLMAFALLSAVRHLSSNGADLSSSYYASRFLASHQISHIYSRDPRNYDRVADPTWDRSAQETGFTAIRLLHPYVQTPLWAFSIEPLSTNINFPAFNTIFLFLLAFTLSATIWLVGRFWAPRTFHPGIIALICAVLYLFESYKYAFALTQTHLLFVLLTIAALMLARRGFPVWAGALLAVAAAIKITPAFLLLYWLVNRQKRAAASFVLFSLALLAGSVLATGWALNLAFLRNLSEISNMLLVSWNNQSLAAFLLAGHYPVSEQDFWHSLPLPATVKWGSALLSTGFTVLGGLLDRKAEEAASPGPPYGAVLAIVGAMVFAPLAWTHYYIVLVVPLMMMLDATLRKRSIAMLVLLVLVCALNFDTQTLGGVLQKYRLLPVVRAQFYSGLLTMAALIWIAVRQRTWRVRLLALNFTPRVSSQAEPQPAGKL